MICQTCLSEEVWKDIPGYEGLYQASTFGNIRTVEGKITSNKLHPTRRWKSRMLKGKGDNPRTGKRVSLWKDGEVKYWLVARLVAITFLGTPPEKYTVNHKDGNRLNNAIDNLEWLSLADNIRHGFATGLYPQKQIKIKRDGITITFRSLSLCDFHLRRRKGYTSEQLLKGKTVLFDDEGNSYCVVNQ